MLTWLLQASKNFQNPTFFLIGIGLMYITGVILLAAVVWKFYQYKEGASPTLEKKRKHFFSTREMLILVLLLFPFWNLSLSHAR